MEQDADIRNIGETEFILARSTEEVRGEVQPASRTKFPCAIKLLLVCNMLRSLSMSAYNSMPIFFIEKCNYSKNVATSVYHLTSSYNQFTPIIGAIVADKWLKPFHALAIGMVFDSMAQVIHPIVCIPDYDTYIEEMTWVAIFARYTFSGLYGRPWSMLAADQFNFPGEKHLFFLYCNINFWITNLALLISLIIMPIIRMDVDCFGTDECYFAFFSIPAGTCILTTLLILLSSSHFVKKSMPKNVIGKVCKCIRSALSNRRKIRMSTNEPPREHWLDYSDCEASIIKDTKRIFKIIKTCLPLIIVHSIFIQSNSRWLLQATKMDTLFYSYHIKPEQLKITHVLLILLIIPLHLRFTIPMLAKRKKNLSLWKIFFGSQIILVAYITSGVLQVLLEATNPKPPLPGHSQLYLVNGFDCPYSMYIPYTQESVILKGLSTYHNDHIEVKGSQTVEVFLHKMAPNLPESMCPTIDPFTVDLHENAAALYAVMGSEEESFRLAAPNDRPITGYPYVKIFYKLKDMSSNYNIKFCKAPHHRCVIDGYLNHTKGHREVYPGIYNIYINNQYMPIQGGVTLKVGGIYLVTLVEDINSTPDSIKMTIGINVLVKPNSIHILWQIPQYVIYTIGEVFYLIPEMEFLFEEAPASVKPMMIDYLLLSKGIAHLIVCLSTESKLTQSIHYLCFSIVAAIAVMIFGISIRNFPYAANS